MLFFVVLVSAYLLVGLWSWRRRWAERDHWRIALGAAMAVAGLAHLLTPTPFLQHLPPWVPARELLVFGTGLVEMALGVALWAASGRARRWVGWVVAGYLIAVFPANVYVAIAGIDVQGQPGGLYPWLRLPFQAVFIWMALWTTGVIADQLRDASRHRRRTRPHRA
jgi:uncharacterized membrane protein